MTDRRRGNTELPAACRELKKIQPTLLLVHNDLGFYEALMASTEIPATASPSEEIQWVAFFMARPCGVWWDTTPSKAAATWMRRLRLKRSLRDKFWQDSWTYYMESRLSLELKAGAPPAAKVTAKRTGKSDEDLAGQIERMTA